MSAAVSLQTSDVLESLARDRFGVRAFRPGQRALIDAVLAKQDALGILPTGGGKSLCYQLPALLLPRPTVVVSPLIALMKDQRDHMVRAHVDAAELDSTLSVEEERACEVEIRHGDHPLIYVTPERLQNPECIAMLRERGVALVAVDEAHCVSQWGHDFRPAYLAIRDAVEKLGRPPILALTATATPETIADIEQQLGMRNPKVVHPSVSRENLAFRVERTVNEMSKRTTLMRLLDEETGTGIVYVATVKMADELFAWMSALRVEVGRYHAKMRPHEREESRHRFMDGTVRVMIATKAFGMGVDKPDIRWVVHHQFPDSIESYVQEAGRAGRDGRAARCVLLYRLEDRRVQTYFLAGKYPSKGDVLKVHQAMREGAKTIAEIASKSGVGRRRTQTIVVHLAQLGIAQASDDPVEVQRIVREYQLRSERDRKKLAAMMHYAQTSECRARVLLEYLGEASAGGCGRCDNCAGSRSIHTCYPGVDSMTNPSTSGPPTRSTTSAR